MSGEKITFRSIGVRFPLLLGLFDQSSTVLLSLIPHTAAKTFWQKDIKTYRNYYKTVKPGTDEFRDMMTQWRETKRNMDGGKDGEDDDDHEFEDANEESQLAYLVAQMKAHPHVQVGVRATKVLVAFRCKILHWT